MFENVHKCSKIIAKLKQSGQFLKQFSIMLLVPILQTNKDLFKTIIDQLFYGFRRSNSFKAGVGLIGLLVSYIVYPSVKNILFSKNINGSLASRPDKYTTGLVNKGNYCYANSVIQALSSIDYFSDYINKFVIGIDENEISSAGLEKTDTEALLLHRALADLLRKLQMVIFEPTNADIKHLVSVLEWKVSGRLSRAQNDAHEFLQVLLEQLHVELSNSHKTSSCKFPFAGTIIESYKCLQCQHETAPKKSTFNIFEAPLPQKYEIDLNDVLMRNSNEIIDNYKCMVCLIRSVITLERAHGFSGTAESIKGKLLALEKKLPDITINEEFDIELQNYLDTYCKYGFKNNVARRSILKQCKFVNAPDIFVIHLSRSTYNGMTFTRNGCKVHFGETLDAFETVACSTSSNEFTKRVRYRLKSIVIHTGSHYSGHYQVLRRKPIIMKSKVSGDIVNTGTTIGEKKPTVMDSNFRRMKSTTIYPFWLISDTNVKEKRISDIVNEQKSVYMLFYERIL